MRILEGLKPEKVFYYFEEISAIPRGSGKTDKIRDYCIDFAKERNLRYNADDAGNIVIYKPANGKTDSETVIIQGHLDMVWEKNDECRIDFEKDGLQLAVEGDYIRATGTTLGGDDGIAVAMGLALLDSDDIIHPPLEILFTADEEVGMSGAMGLDATSLKGKRMINLDSEEEGVMWVSCAGGVRADVSLPVSYVNNDGKSYEISVSGLHGGHSGAEIHKGYANANKVMGRILSHLAEKEAFLIADIGGGLMDNAITRDSRCVVSSSGDISGVVADIFEKIKDDYICADPDIRISATEVSSSEKVMDEESTKAVIGLLCELPSGVISMSKSIEGLVETSLNLGILKNRGDSVSFCFAVRSGVDAEKDKLCQRLEEIAESFGCGISFKSKYPAWEYKEDSVLRDKMAEIYREMYGKDMTVTAIHAGLECGLFCGKINGLDCVSLGPDMIGIHTPQERLSISSSERVWNYLLKVLEAI